MTEPAPEEVGLPVGGPTTLAALKGLLEIAAEDVRDDTRLARIVAAVNSYVRGLPVAQVAAGAADWTGEDVQHVVEGATMLGARLWRRRNSPEGVAAFGDQGAVYVQRNDPDIAMLLKLGSHARPAVG